MAIELFGVNSFKHFENFIALIKTFFLILSFGTAATIYHVTKRLVSHVAV